MAANSLVRIIGCLLEHAIALNMITTNPPKESV
jgi:hypothetical protein